jgi:uncharacterized protein YdaU (DUF1376 family)
MEHGAYNVLLDHYYLTERPLPSDLMHLQRICRAFADGEVDALQSVLRQFFVISPDGYRNDKADRELSKRVAISEKRKEAAVSRHNGDRKQPRRKHAKAHANGDAHAPANADTITNTSLEESSKEDSLSQFSPDVLLFEGGLPLHKPPLLG